MQHTASIVSHPANLRTLALAMVGALLLCAWEKPGPSRSKVDAQATRTTSVETPSRLPEATKTLRSFLARGVIRELPVNGNTVVVRHEEIAGFMPRMTMEFNLRDTNELGGFAVGDTITFRVQANDTESWIEGLRRAAATESISIPRSDPSSSSLPHIARLKTGDTMPDVELLAEDGRTIKLSDFKGRALAFTFLFTRCPLPDFCPRMNQHFNRARELLLQRPGGPTNWQFLSISFDPEFDGPRVLTSYAHSYRGQAADGWLFASASTNAMSAMVSSLDFRFVNEAGSFVHNLRTVVLDTQRRIHRQFDGNKWKAADLAEALAEAARSTR
ncbi:MAG: SCO family protein [Verrucomicrobia bacterium]|nr:SCO family protein [Verrucomicrobiota bacterium]